MDRNGCKCIFGEKLIFNCRCMSIRHPLLQTPQNYLKGPIFLHSKLLDTGNYDLDALEHNPFADSLLLPKLDVSSRTRVPQKQCIRLAVTSESPPILPENPSRKRSLQLRPLAFDMNERHPPTPSSYILNNQKYISNLVQSGKWRQYVPSKFRFKNLNEISNRVQIPPNIDTEIYDSYVADIREKLLQLEDGPTGSMMEVTSGSPGLKFTDHLIVSLPSSCFPQLKSYTVSLSDSLALTILRFVHFQS